MNRPDQNRCDYCGAAFDSGDACPLCGVKSEVTGICQTGETVRYQQLPIVEIHGRGGLINVDGELSGKCRRNECSFCDNMATKSRWFDGRKMPLCDKHYQRIYNQGNVHLIKAKVKGVSQSITQTEYITAKD